MSYRLLFLPTATIRPRVPRPPGTLYAARARSQGSSAKRRAMEKLIYEGRGYTFHIIALQPPNFCNSAHVSFRLDMVKAFEKC